MYPENCLELENCKKNPVCNLFLLDMRLRVTSRPKFYLLPATLARRLKANEARCKNEVLPKKHFLIGVFTSNFALVHKIIVGKVWNVILEPVAKGLK